MGGYTNTRDIMGDQETLDALIAHTLTTFTDESVTQVGNNAFYNQAQMEEICLPNVGSIGSNAFYGCSGMKRFKIGLEKGTVATLSSYSAFSGTGRSAIYVPDALVSTYKAASQWSNAAVKDRIFGISDMENGVEWDETEISDSWDTIAAKVNAGTAAENYSAGQYKDVDLGTEGIIRMQIVAKNTDPLFSGEGNAQLTWIAMDLLATTHRMNPALDNNTEGTGSIGGFAASEMRTYLLETIWPLLPEVVKGIIKPVRKYSRAYDTSGSAVNNVETSETLWIPSHREMFGDSSYETTGPTYAFAFPDNATRIRKRYGNASAESWWLRSAFGASYWRCVYSDGSAYSDGASSAYGVCLGFCT